MGAGSAHSRTGRRHRRRHPAVHGQPDRGRRRRGRDRLLRIVAVRLRAAAGRPALPEGPDHPAHRRGAVAPAHRHDRRHAPPGGRDRHRGFPGGRRRVPRPRRRSPRPYVARGAGPVQRHPVPGGRGRHPRPGHRRGLARRDRPTGRPHPRDPAGHGLPGAAQAPRQGRVGRPRPHGRGPVDAARHQPGHGRHRRTDPHGRGAGGAGGHPVGAHRHRAPARPRDQPPRGWSRRSTASAAGHRAGGRHPHRARAVARRRLDVYADHRMATAGAIIGLRVPGVQWKNIATTGKTMPDFDIGGPRWSGCRSPRTGAGPGPPQPRWDESDVRVRPGRGRAADRTGRAADASGAWWSPGPGAVGRRPRGETER